MSRKISIYSIYIALAFIFSYIEAMFPLNIGIPGVKPGFANIVILIVIYNENKIKDAYAIAILRVVLVGFTFGSLYTLAYSFAGTLLSTTVMFIVHRISLFSVTGVSIIGGVLHNIGQLITAIIILSTGGLIYYLPVLIVSGIAAGTLTGIITDFSLRNIKKVHKQ